MKLHLNALKRMIYKLRLAIFIGGMVATSHFLGGGYVMLYLVAWLLVIVYSNMLEEIKLEEAERRRKTLW